MSLLRQNQTDQVETWTTVRRPENYSGTPAGLPNDGAVEVPVANNVERFPEG